MKKPITFLVVILLFSNVWADFDLMSSTWWETATLADVQNKLAAGANVNVGHGILLHYAISDNKNPEVIIALIKAGADVNAKHGYREETPLHKTIERIIGINSLEVIIALIKAGADVNVKHGYGKTPLQEAARRSKNPEVITTLVKAGANIHVKDKYGDTPLHEAARGNKNPEIITALIKAGADVNAKNEHGTTPLLEAASYDSNLEVMTALIKAGADVNAKDKNGIAPFSYKAVQTLMLRLSATGANVKIDISLYDAVREGSLEIIKVLIAQGTDVNAKDKDGFTPLQRAAWGSKNPEVITTLVKAGANIHAKDKYGDTPLHEAARGNKNPKIITTLIKAGANIHAKNKNGGTPLHSAAKYNKDPEIITTLIKAGASVNAKDWDGETPLDYARSENKSKHIAILTNAGATRGTVRDPSSYSMYSGNESYTTNSDSSSVWGSVGTIVGVAAGYKAARNAGASTSEAREHALGVSTYTPEPVRNTSYNTNTSARSTYQQTTSNSDFANNNPRETTTLAQSERKPKTVDDVTGCASFRRHESSNPGVTNNCNENINVFFCFGKITYKNERALKSDHARSSKCRNLSYVEGLGYRMRTGGGTTWDGCENLKPGKECGLYNRHILGIKSTDIIWAACPSGYAFYLRSASSGSQGNCKKW